MFILLLLKDYNNNMVVKSVFNGTVCLLGALILLIHIFNIVLKKNRRKDETTLLIFITFTMVHFLTYLAFVIINHHLVSIDQPSDTLIMTFYTIFYIMNNVEVFLFYQYLSSYINHPSKPKQIANVVNIVLFSIIVVTDIINIFTRMYFTSIGGEYKRETFMIISQIYQFVILAVAFFIVLFEKSLNRREKVGFSIYLLLPAVSIIFQNLFAGYAIAYVSLLLAVEMLFLFLNVEKNIRIEEDEKKLKDAEVKIMMSQIQPHFVYNTLSSISTLITIDPHQAQSALDEFTDYIRMNFSTLTQTKLVSFTDELRHIKTYVDLEKLRFNNRLNVIYDIQVLEFEVPPLSVQPIVENAIKHGILKKVEGGTVIIKSVEKDDSYVITVSDNGVGFNIDEIDFKGNKHIGLNNVRHRIHSMCNGDILFESEVNKGTTVTITFYKEK